MVVGAHLKAREARDEKTMYDAGYLKGLRGLALPKPGRYAPAFHRGWKEGLPVGKDLRALRRRQKDRRDRRKAARRADRARERHNQGVLRDEYLAKLDAAAERARAEVQAWSPDDADPGPFTKSIITRALRDHEEPEADPRKGNGGFRK